jgi:hypothetical protein
MLDTLEQMTALRFGARGRAALALECLSSLQDVLYPIGVRSGGWLENKIEELTNDQASHE